MVLFDNGEVYGWGNNQEAILANNHIREYVYATGYYKPTPIHKNYNGNVVDFDISTNMFVMLTDTGDVYYAGFGKYMSPTLANVPGNSKVVAVGASNDGFGVSCEDGNVYGWNVYYDGNAKYFDSNFTRLPKEAFNGTVTSLGGKYGGRFAVTS